MEAVGPQTLNAIHTVTTHQEAHQHVEHVS